VSFDQQSYEFIDAAMAERRKKVTIKWNENLETVLVASVLKRKAYMKTKDNSLETKWSLVQSDCSKSPFFFEYLSKLTVECLKKKFHYMKHHIESTYALDGEGANLSGLPENISSNDKMVYNMIVEESTYKRDKEEENEKKRKRNTAMLSHETNILSISAANAKKDDEQVSSSSAESSFSTGISSYRSSKSKRPDNADEVEINAGVFKEQNQQLIDMQKEELDIRKRELILKEKEAEKNAQRINKDEDIQREELELRKRELALREKEVEKAAQNNSCTDDIKALLGLVKNLAQEVQYLKNNKS
jgi:stress response protein YsnF